MRRVEEAVGGWPVIDRNGYPYVVSPLMDGVPSVDPGMLSDVAEEMVRIGDFDCDIILAPEAMGIMYAAVISERTGIPFSVVRKRRYGLDGEVPVSVDTGYSHSEQFINGVTAGMRVVIVDDVVSTGGTLAAIVSALRRTGAIPVCAVAAVDKSRDIEALSRGVGIPVRAAVRIAVRDGRAVVPD